MRIHWAHISSTILNKAERARRAERKNLMQKPFAYHSHRLWFRALFFLPILQRKHMVWIHFTCGNICLLGFLFDLIFLLSPLSLSLSQSFSDFPRWGFFPSSLDVFFHCAFAYLSFNNIVFAFYGDDMHRTYITKSHRIDSLLPAHNHFNKIEKSIEIMSAQVYSDFEWNSLGKKQTFQFNFSPVNISNGVIGSK